MSYSVEWMGGLVGFWIVLLLLLVPWFAAIAVVVATIAVVAATIAVFVASLASPYLLVRNVRRRLAQRRTRSIHLPGAILKQTTRDAA